MHTMMTGTDDRDSATYAYLISENGGRTYRTVGIVDSAMRERIEAQPLTDKAFVRMFGRIG